MAINATRSMNMSLHKGAVEGKYKQMFPDRECAPVDHETNYHMKDELSLLYYGWGMKEHQDVPAGPNHATITGYVPNRLQNEAHHGPVLGRAW